jgi:hypothetical protein
MKYTGFLCRRRSFVLKDTQVHPDSLSLGLLIPSKFSKAFQGRKF